MQPEVVMRVENPLGRQFYRVTEVSQLLGIPKPTLYRWIADGVLPAKRVQRILLVPIDAVNSVITAGEPAQAAVRDESPIK